MQIGPLIHSSQSVPRQGGQQATALGHSSSDSAASSAQSNPDRGASVVSAREFIQAAEQSARSREQQGFYSMDRALSLRGQAALDAYQTTSQFVTGNDRAQLVGVDLYV